MTERFNINNDAIFIAKCEICGHEIDVSKLLTAPRPNGLNHVVTSLEYCKAFAKCCNKPMYWHEY